MPEVDTLYQQNWRNFCEISNSFLFLSPYQQRTDVSSSSLVGTWSLMLSGITNVTCSSKASVFFDVVTRTCCRISSLWWSVPVSSLAPTEMWAPPVAWTGHSGLGHPMVGLRHRASSETWSHHSHHSVRSHRAKYNWPHTDATKNYSCHPQGSWRWSNKITLKKIQKLFTH